MPKINVACLPFQHDCVPTFQLTKLLGKLSFRLLAFGDALDINHAILHLSVLVFHRGDLATFRINWRDGHLFMTERSFLTFVNDIAVPRLSFKQFIPESTVEFRTLLCGEDKRTQTADINRACEYCQDWQRSTDDER